MNRKLITLAVAGALALGSIGYLQAQHGGEPGSHHHMGNPLDKLVESLNLTPEQKTRVQPVLDQAKPQITAIHQEAMAKMKAVMENTTAQIRPLLTAEQQQKFDTLRKAHEDMHNAMEAMQDAEKQ